MKQVLNAPIDWPGADTPTRQNIGVLREVREAVNQNGGELTTMQAGLLALMARVNPDRVRWVAMSGAQYSSIADACESITDASYEKRYTVLVAPGLYGGFEIPDFVSVIGLDTHACMIECADHYGAVRMGNETLLQNFLILSARDPNAWGICSFNKTGVRVRDVDILGEMLATPARTAQGIWVTGDSWETVLLERVTINYLGTTGWGIKMEGNATTSHLCDVHVEAFVDALYATTGGCVYLKDLWGPRIRGGLFRSKTGSYTLLVEATPDPPPNPVDVMLEGGVKLEFGHVVGLKNTAIYKASAVADFIEQNEAGSIVVDYQKQWLPMPSLSDYAWTNQGSTTCALGSHGSWIMTQPKTRASITAPSLGILRQDTPTPPYSLTARISFLASAKEFVKCGLIWRDSASGKCTSWEVSGTAAAVPYMACVDYDSVTARNASPWAFVSPLMASGGPIWLRVRDNGTLRQVYSSLDGVVWQGWFERSRTTFLTADQVGIFVDAENSATPNLDSVMMIEALTLTTG
jgi:hypothetical protein